MLAAHVGFVEVYCQALQAWHFAEGSQRPGSTRVAFHCDKLSADPEKLNMLKALRAGRADALSEAPKLTELCVRAVSIDNTHNGFKVALPN